MHPESSVAMSEASYRNNTDMADTEEGWAMGEPSLDDLIEAGILNEIDLNELDFNETDLETLLTPSDQSHSSGSNESNDAHTSRSTPRTSPPDQDGPNASEARTTESPAFMSTPILNRDSQCWLSFVEGWRIVCRAAMTSAPKALPLGLGAEHFPLGRCSKGFPASLMHVCRDFYKVAKEVLYGENEWTFYARPSDCFISDYFTNSPLTEVMPYMKIVEVAFEFLGCVCDTTSTISDESVTILRDNVVEICNVLDTAHEINELKLTWRETTLFDDNVLATACGLNPATHRIGKPLQEAMAKVFQPLLLLPNLPLPVSCKDKQGNNLDTLHITSWHGTRLGCLEEAFSRSVEFVRGARNNGYAGSETIEQVRSRQRSAWENIRQEVATKRAALLDDAEEDERAAMNRAAEEYRLAREERARQEAERRQQELKERNDKRWRRRLSANHAYHKMGYGQCTPECFVLENLHRHRPGGNIVPNEAAPFARMDQHEWPGMNSMNRSMPNQSPFVAGNVLHPFQQAGPGPANLTPGVNNRGLSHQHDGAQSYFGAPISDMDGIGRPISPYSYGFPLR